MRIPRMWLLLILIAAFPLSAVAVDKSVFGIVIGAPLSLPQCQLRGIVWVNEPCIALAPTHKPWGSDEYLVRLRNANDIPWLTGGPAVEVVGGKVEEVVFFTGGITRQQEVLTRLTRKYGNPTRISRRLVQNSFGATFSAVIAEWIFKDLRVRFEGVAGNLDEGQVTVSTPSYVKRYRDWEKERANAAPKF